VTRRTAGPAPAALADGDRSPIDGRRGYVLLCLIWGSTWLGIKVGLDAGMPPLLGWRCASCSRRWSWSRCRVVDRRGRRFVTAVAWRLALLIGVGSFGFGYGCTYIGGM
jgi:hypothetical protein